MAWGLWGSVCAALWRYLLPRYVFRFSNKLLGVALSYAAMIAFFFAALGLLDVSGWNFKASNREPIQRVAEAVFFFTTFGVPLLLGGPIVLALDLLAFLARKLGEPTK